MRHAPFLISIHPQYVTAILAGAKTVECRKSNIGLAPGAFLYLYATAPKKAILGEAYVDQLYSGAPAELWSAYANKTGVTEEEFFSYYKGADKAVLIALRDVRAYGQPVFLETLRAIQDKFSPPQTARRLGPQFAALELLISRD